MPASRADVIVALAAPAAVVVVGVATGFYGNAWGGPHLLNLWGATPFAAVTVAKVAVLAWVVGRGVSKGWLRIAVFVWCVALVDLGVFSRFTNHGESMLVALTVAELGLLLCWAILSATHWVWRLPIGLVAIASILPLATEGLGNYVPWMPLLTIGIVCQLVVYVTLRVRGFRITDDPGKATVDGNAAGEKASQFGVKHLLIWSSAMPPLLVVIKLIDWRLGWWLNGYGVFSAELPDTLTVGVAIASGSLAMVGMVLGAGPAWARIAIGATIGSFIGFALHEWSSARYAAVPPWPQWNTVARMLVDMGGGWPPWCLLAFGLLAALLLFLRASGYRLQRQR